MLFPFYVQRHRPNIQEKWILTKCFRAIQTPLLSPASFIAVLSNQATFSIIVIIILHTTWATYKHKQGLAVVF
jgi:hypothetical protein